MIGTSGIDFRFDTSSGLASGNVLSGRIRDRNGASHVAGTNLEQVDVADFSSWYEAPLQGDLALQGDVSELIGAGEAHPDVSDDYCGRPRPAVPTLGALEHSLENCATLPPPGPPVDPGEGGSGEGGSGGGDGTGGSSGAGGEGGEPGEPVEPGGGGGGGNPGESPNAFDDEPSCSCSSRGGGAGDAILYLVLGAALVGRRLFGGERLRCLD